MKKRQVIILSAALLGLLLPLLGLGGVRAGSGIPAIAWWRISGGGAPSGGGEVAINDTLGQPITGPSSGGDVGLGAGYWYGAAVTPTPTPTATATSTPTNTPTTTLTSTSTPSDTPTSSPTPTDIATPTVTHTPTLTATPTHTPTETLTPTPTHTPTPALLMATFYSVAREDGEILESSEDSGVGGAVNSKGKLMSVGDDGSDKQYRGFLSFNTAPLPDGARVVSGTLTMREYRITGDPYTTHGSLWVDMRAKSFGRYNWLEEGDFNAKANLPQLFELQALGLQAFPLQATTIGGLLAGELPASALEYVNLRGRTQFRLRFELDDDDDGSSDVVQFYTANDKSQSNWPVLRVYYYAP